MRFPRSSGILLHPTSLPGPYGSGDFGPNAYYFIDWLVVAGQKLWQMLPLEPTGCGDSPYAALSAFAGNPLLISLEELVSKGWLAQNEIVPLSKFEDSWIDYELVGNYRLKKLQIASKNFFKNASVDDRNSFSEFCEINAIWLDDFALFMALEEKYNYEEWSLWDKPIRLRDPKALISARKELEVQIQFHKFIQWCFFRQWYALKKYANDRGIKIIGDMPIFVSYQSADVWTRQELFYLDKKQKPTVVSGVPPDYFSKTGQRWGNPLYRWNVMEAEGYKWFIERIRRTLNLVDILRIDHFRGFASYWEIPAYEDTAVNGKWAAGPGEQIFEAIEKELGKLPIIAEDLGIITPDVITLRDKYDFPGMIVLQFAFSGDPKNLFLPHNHLVNSAVYTGTHDNDTTLGWYGKATESERAFFRKYSGSNGAEANWDLIRMAQESAADISIIPMQDVLALGSEARMNFPGTVYDNWQWRFSWDMVDPHHALRLYELSAISGRCDPNRLDLGV